jgi:hypothetical protein
MKGPYKVFETSQDLKDALGSERTKEEIAEDGVMYLAQKIISNGTCGSSSRIAS